MIHIHILIEAEAYCKDIDAIFLETSALTAVGVNELFTHISEYCPLQLENLCLVLYCIYCSSLNSSRLKYSNSHIT